MVKCTGRGLVVKRPGALSKVQMLNLVLGVGVFSLLPKNVFSVSIVWMGCFAILPSVSAETGPELPDRIILVRETSVASSCAPYKYKTPLKPKTHPKYTPNPLPKPKYRKNTKTLRKPPIFVHFSYFFVCWFRERVPGVFWGVFWTSEEFCILQGAHELARPSVYPLQVLRGLMKAPIQGKSTAQHCSVPELSSPVSPCLLLGGGEVSGSMM